MPSVRDIAKQSGVSITTVSRVLNNHPGVSDAARSKVLAAANRSRYIPTVGRRSTVNIAFVYTGEASLGSPFDAALMQGMSEGMQRYGFDLMVLGAEHARHPRETFSQMLIRRGVRGAVLRTTAQSRHLCESIAEEGFPAVVVGDRFDSPRVSYIDSDSRSSSREAIDHLIGLGHREIAVCVNIVDDSDHADRLQGYREALTRHGIEVDERLVMRVPAHREGGVQLMRRVMTMVDRPTALYITDPMVAVGAMNQAQRMGLQVPEDISVVGFDDSELRHIVYPPMTAVCQDAREIGREAFALLHGMINNADGAKVHQTSLRTWLEIHGSTGPCPSVRMDPTGQTAR